MKLALPLLIDGLNFNLILTPRARGKHLVE